MTFSRRTSLLRLQQSLMSPESSPAAVEGLDLLPFDAAQQSWTIPCADVARVMMSAAVISLSGYSQLPDCVVGVVGTDNEMLTVVDAGLLLGREPTQATMKTRLIVFGDGELRGFALLVERVRDRVTKEVAGRQELQASSAASLHTRLLNKTPSKKEA